jgi:hypothetical protein
MKKPTSVRAAEVRTSKLDKIEIRKLDKIETTQIITSSGSGG